MKKTKLNKKGTAGLDVYLGIVASVFVVGLIVMAFQLMGSKLMDSDSAYSTSGSIAVVNESHVMNGTTKIVNLDVSSYRDVVCSVTEIYNGTTAVKVPAGNYTVSNCRITQVAGSPFENRSWATTYSYVYEAPTGAVTVINDTMTATSDTTDWFSIFIIVGAMVVLILLIVMIIITLRGSGLMGSGGGA